MSAYEVERRGRLVVLPPWDGGETVGFSSWKQAERRLRDFAGGHLSRGSRAAVRVQVALVHRADNTYNANAVAVVVPGVAGSLDDRHLGYLHDHYLRQVGPRNLPALIAHAGGEVVCHAVIESDATVRLDLPHGRELGDAIRVFLDLPDRPTGTRAAQREGPAAQTANALALLATFDRPQGSPAGIRITMGHDHVSDGHLLELRDSATGADVGAVVGGVLHVIDERDREQVRRLVAEQDVPVRGPLAPPPPDPSSPWGPGTVPNAVVERRREGLLLKAREPDPYALGEAFAIFHPDADVLWVEDGPLVDVAVLVLARHGLAAGEVRLPRQPWGLDDELEYLAHEHVPAATDPQFVLHQRFARGRRELFAVHELSGAVEPCRLCGAAALALTTPICVDQIAYCAACLEQAYDGRGSSLGATARAVRSLVRSEFDGELFLSGQLHPLHVNPADPVDGAFVDRALRLRSSIDRSHPWTHVLEATGLANEGLRTGRGTLIRARDGHLCHSLRERAVCDFLHLHGIAHDREPVYPVDPDYNPSGLRRADWVLGDGTLVELWGLPDDPAYAAKMAQKQALARRHGLRLVELVEGDLRHLPSIFARWTPPGAPTGWTWSPRLLTPGADVAPEPPKVPRVRATPPREPIPDDGRGSNAFNDAQRDERLERCRRAVELQQAGRTRPQIAAELGVGVDTVKGLLRDGKFFADPATDPVRRSAAEQAHEAQGAGATRAEFRAAHALTAARAAEAWKDARAIFGAGR